jgi:hypothetical protein
MANSLANTAIVTTLPYKAGYLRKITDYVFDNWAQRYCYLDRTTFAYFKSN